ncbi:hypothetical protein PIB30_047260 [Stylosanthes scabra]|uniref:Uncharacterized protein n=1 Tax=Stylosanthes scabra TaxID=79078 RepID=A0ABU6QG30_9FABA|nr:hypothetical protein [Stylosanthes scabra]
MQHVTDLVIIEIVPEPDFHGNRGIWISGVGHAGAGSCRMTNYCSIHVAQTRRGGIAVDTRGAVHHTRKTRGKHRPHRLRPRHLGLEHLDIRDCSQEETGPDVLHEQAESTWKQLTSAKLDDVWDVTTTSASAAHDIVEGSRQCIGHHEETGGACSYDPSAGYPHMLPHRACISARQLSTHSHITSPSSNTTRMLHTSMVVRATRYSLCLNIRLTQPPPPPAAPLFPTSIADPLLSHAADIALFPNTPPHPARCSSAPTSSI